MYLCVKKSKGQKTIYLLTFNTYFIMKDFNDIFNNFAEKESHAEKSFNDATKAEKICQFGKFGFEIEPEKKYRFTAVAKRADFDSDAEFIKFCAKVSPENVYRVFDGGKLKAGAELTYNAYKKGDALTLDQRISELTKQANKAGKYTDIVNAPVLVDVLGGENWLDFCRWIVANSADLLK